MVDSFINLIYFVFLLLMVTLENTQTVNHNQNISLFVLSLTEKDQGEENYIYDIILCSLCKANTLRVNKGLTHAFMNESFIH